MKRVLISLIAIISLTSGLSAGKNEKVATEPPIPVPEAPKPSPKIAPPLGLYIGGGFTYAKTECKCQELQTTNGVTDGKSSGKSYGVNLRTGYDFNEFIGVEARYLYTPWGDKDKTLKHYGIYLKPTYGVNKNLDVYGLLGYGKTECEYQDLDEKGFGWGVGAEYLIGKKEKGGKKGWGIYAEYSQPIRKKDDKDIETNVGSVGVSYHY